MGRAGRSKQIILPQTTEPDPIGWLVGSAHPFGLASRQQLKFRVWPTNSLVIVSKGLDDWGMRNRYHSLLQVASTVAIIVFHSGMRAAQGGWIAVEVFFALAGYNMFRSSRIEI